MKKYLCILVCILICFISACSPYKDVVESSEKETIMDRFEDREIIDSGKYYRIYSYKKSITKVYYNIYNSKGEIVLSETTDRPLIIEMLNNDIVDIKIDMGTGITIHRYYDVEENVFSQDFQYVLSNFNELVAYIDVQKENPFENRKVIVQNIFDRDSFYKEFQLDFSNIDTPVIDASFSNDGSSLNIVYLSGTEQSEKTVVLPLI